jgi:hypothetical protein
LFALGFKLLILCCGFFVCVNSFLYDIMIMLMGVMYNCIESYRCNYIS